MRNPEIYGSVTPVRADRMLIGVLGGFTTFSSFSIETLGLIDEGAWLKAVANMLASLGLCVGATWLGVMLGRWV